MRILHCLTGLAALLLLAAAPVLAADPAMVIVFAGNTYGYFDPCPTCGPQKLGGLARRATFIRQLRQDPSMTGKTLVVAGAWEFLPEVAVAPAGTGKNSGHRQGPCPNRLRRLCGHPRGSPAAGRQKDRPAGRLHRP